MSDAIDLFGLTAGPVVRGFKWLTFEQRVVSSVRKAMNRRGYEVNSKALRLVMYGADFAKRLAESRGNSDALIDDLASTIVGNSDDLQNSAIALRDVLLEAFRSRLEGASRSSDFKDNRDEARTRQIIQSVENASADDGLFETRLSTFHPLRARDLRELREDYPRVTRILGLLTDSADQLALLKRWAATPPDLVTDAPPIIYGILADVAGDHRDEANAKTVAAKFLEHGLSRGLAPRGYWTIRLMNAKGVSDLDEATAFLAELRGEPLVEAILHPDGGDTAIEMLNRWKPETHWEEVHRRVLLSELNLRLLHVDEAIRVGRETFDEFDSTAAGLIAARALTTRHMMHAAIVNRNDLPDALLLSVRARSARLKWGTDSGPALALELRVRRLLSDEEGALDIANGAGEVPATAEELDHPEVITELAMIQAEHGDIAVAKRLINRAPENKRANIAAVIAEQEDRTEDAAALWVEAIDASDDLADKSNMALQLALHGIRSSVIDELKKDNAGIAEELDLIAALFGNEPGALERFRGFANRSFRGSLFLYIYLNRAGDAEAAAQAAREGGARWSDPDLWLEAAKHSARKANHTSAIAEVNSALIIASEEWGGRRRAYRLLVEQYSSADDWKGALTAAATLATEEPDNPSATWALVVCQLHLNDLGGAFQSWQRHGSPEPRGEMEVGAWIELLGAFGTQVGSARDAQKIANRFPTNERLRGALLGVLFFQKKESTDDIDHEEQEDEEEESGDSSEANEPTPVDPDIMAFREMLSSYIRDFPDGAIRQVKVHLDDVTASLREQIGEREPDPDLEKKLSTGELPIGLAGELYGKTYLESLMARDFGPVFAGTANIESDREAITVAHSAGVVIDTSALLTLGRLPVEVRDILGGHFANGRVLLEQHRDATVGARNVSRDSGLSYRPQSGSVPDGFDRRTPEELAERASLAATVEASFGKYASDPHPEIVRLPLGDQRFSKPFLLAADRALELAVPLWCDDRPVREVVRGEGGASFGTPELLFHVRNEGSIDPGLIDLAEATLISHGIVGVRFSDTVWDLAASIAPAPTGLINAIKFAGNDNITERAKFAGQLIDAHVEQPEVLGGFVYALGQWLGNIALNEEAATKNLEILSRQLLSKTWMSPSTLPYCVAGLRSVDTKVNAVDIFLLEIYRGFELMAERVESQVAAEMVFGLVSLLDAADGLRVRNAIITGRFQ